jgi:hypothetical protein
MNKKIKALSAFCLCSFVSFAHAGNMGVIAVDSTLPKENFYAGVGVGGSFNKDQLLVTGLDTNRTTSSTQNTNRWQGNVFIGYGHTFDNCWFLGVEANTYFPNYSTNINTIGVSSPVVYNTYSSTHLKYNDYLGLDFLPGYRVNNENLIYARLGMGFRDYYLSQNNTSLNDKAHYYDSQVVGGRFGAGITHAWTNHLAVSVDYFYSYFPTWTTPVWQTFNIQKSGKSSANYIGVSLVYT